MSIGESNNYLAQFFTRGCQRYYISVKLMLTYVDKFLNVVRCLPGQVFKTA